MNQEIIRSIAKQVTQECISEGISQAWSYEDKVIRLVIKECINVITKEYLSMDVSSDWEDGKLCGLIYANMLIMERFGIDEMPYE